MLDKRRPWDTERCVSDACSRGTDERSANRHWGTAKKLVEAFIVDGSSDTGHPEDELLKMSALIRANMGLNPAELNEMEFAEAYAQAVWLESFRLKNTAELLVAVLGGKKKK